MHTNIYIIHTYIHLFIFITIFYLLQDYHIYIISHYITHIYIYYVYIYMYIYKLCIYIYYVYIYICLHIHSSLSRALGPSQPRGRRQIRKKRHVRRPRGHRELSLIGHVIVPWLAPERPGAALPRGRWFWAMAP